MALVDWEAVVLDLEAYVDGKAATGGRSFGHQELTAKIRELKLEHRQMEGLVEKATRLYADELADVLSQRSSPEDHTNRVEGHDRALSTS